MSKPIVSVSTINSIVYDLAHDLDLTEKAWLIPALRSHVLHLAQATLNMPGHTTLSHYEEAVREIRRLVDQWVEVHERAAGRRGSA